MKNLESKLKLIGDLEEKHRIVGISFSVNEDGKTLSTDESADFVIAAIKSVVKRIADFDRIPVSRISGAVSFTNAVTSNQ